MYVQKDSVYFFLTWELNVKGLEMDRIPFLHGFVGCFQQDSPIKGWGTPVRNPLLSSNIFVRQVIYLFYKNRYFIPRAARSIRNASGRGYGGSSGSGK